MHPKYVASPRRQVEIEPVRRQAGPLTVVDCCSQPVRKPPGPTGEVAPRCQVALALVTGIVHRDEAAEVSRAGLRERDEGVVRLVFLPRGTGLEELPLPVAEGRVPQAGNKGVVEGGDRRVRCLDRPPP